MKFDVALELILQLLMQAAEVNARRQAAIAEGRDSLNDADLDALSLTNDAARNRLAEAIARAKAEGR